MMRVVLLATLALGFAPRLTGADRPVPVKDAAARMTVPEGFRVTLFAGEPDVVQPIAMTFDDRGRMWVVECLSYPRWRADGKGNDRVTILEDTDGDGTHDKRTVFLDNGSNLSGIELGFGGVWICSLPNLIFVPDKDRDDKPDGPPEVLLDGWNLKDTRHNVFNSLGWGPDGWLYGCNGIQARSKVGRPGTPEKDRVYMDCGVWRYHPTRKVFEPFAHGTTNPFGLDWDEYGELFITNCVIDHLWHVVPGGHYRRMHGQDANPYTFGLMGPASDHKHWGGGHWTTARADQKTGAVQKAHDDAGGGHAHSGCSVYLGDNFPPEYRNSVFMCNIHGNRLNRDTLHRQGSGHVGKHAPDFLNANDPWFRGICVKYGPDGGLYVSDWTDTGECHNYEVADTTNGRIYKVTYGTPKPWKGDLSELSDAELVKLQRHKNDLLARHARRLLHERATAGKLNGEVADELRAMLTNSPDAPNALRAAWALHVAGLLSEGDVQLMVKHADPAVRGYAAILALDNPAPSKLARELVSGLGTDESAHVRRVLAGQCHRLNGYYAHTAIGWLLRRPADPDTTLMLWYAIEPTVSVDSVAELARVPHTLLSEFAVRKLVSDSQVRAAALLACVAVMTDTSADGAPAPILRGIRDGLSGVKSPDVPKGWDALYPRLAASKFVEVRSLADDVGLIFRDPKATATLRTRLTDRSKPAADRVSAVERLAARKVPGLAPTLWDLLADPAVRGAALRALAAYPDTETPAAILKHYPQFTATEKADAIQTLASRPTFALALLDAIGKGTVPKSDLTAFTARQLQALNHKEVGARLAKVWGTVRPASATRAAQVEKYKSLLTADRLKSADLSNGRAVFAKHCASCHKLFGEGGDVGPELTGSQRANLDYVLENVLDPSAVVPGEYRMTAFALLDGRTLTGIVRRETPQAVTVRTVNEEITVPVADLDARKPTTLSVMPDGLFDALREDEVRDLVAYLASPRQVSLPTAGP